MSCSWTIEPNPPKTQVLCKIEKYLSNVAAVRVRSLPSLDEERGGLTRGWKHLPVI